MPDSSIKGQQKLSVMQSLMKFVAGIGKFTLLLCLILILMIPAIYHFGSYNRHQPDPHPLYNLFNKQQYNILYKNLLQKDSKKSIVIGDFKSGLKQFLDHFANMRTNDGYQIIVNEIYSDDIPIVPYLRQLKHSIQEKLDIESTKSSTWIIIDENQYPAQQLGLIMARHPKDRFIVAVDKKVKLNENNEFKKYNFPPLSEKQFKNAVVTQLKVLPQNIQPIYNYFGGIAGIFDIIDLDQQGLVPQNILDEYFRSSSILVNDDKVIVQKLCSQGPQKAQNLSKTLQGFGTLLFNQTIYWQNRLAELNYELQSHKVCPADAVVPQKILNEIAEIKRKEDENKRKSQSSSGGGKKPPRRSRK